MTISVSILCLPRNGTLLIGSRMLTVSVVVFAVLAPLVHRNLSDLPRQNVLEARHPIWRRTLAPLSAFIVLVHGDCSGVSDFVAQPDVLTH